MPNYDTTCDYCGIHGEQMIETKEVSDDWRGKCKICGEVEVRRVFRRAPATRVGGSGSDREINSMKRSFDQRFVKSGEMDQVRHKHGDAFDESLAAGAVRRIKGGEKTHWDKD